MWPTGRTPAGVLGVGTDLVEVARVRAALGRQPGLRERLFTEEEWAYAQRHRDPMPHLAARFAAKEAVMKALGVGWGRHAAWHEIEVVRERGGPPRIELSGSAAATARRLGIVRLSLSLTHAANLAMAFVVAEGEEPR